MLKKKTEKKKTKNDDKNGRRTTLYLYDGDLDNVNTLATYAHTNGVRRTNVSLIVRAAVAVLASSPSKKFLDALEQVSKADQRFTGGE